MTRRSRDELALRREALATRAALQRIELAATLDQAREISLARKGDRGDRAAPRALARDFAERPDRRIPRAALDALGGLGARARAARIADRALGDGGGGPGWSGLVGRAVAADGRCAGRRERLNGPST